MFMANDYTDSFAGDPYYILKGEQLSAAGMTIALNTKEKVANKKDTVNNDSTEYPSSKAVYDSLNEINNKLAVLNSLSTLGFFPRGTILPFNSTAWDEASADFKKIWKICDGQNGTINLVGRFIRGGAYANYGATGGTDTSSLPKHTHSFSGNFVDGVFGRIGADINNTNSYLFTEVGGCFAGIDYMSPNDTYTTDDAGRKGATGYRRIYFSMTPSGSISETGSSSADNRPAFTTLIFIQKMT
jgi:hypothetical protein